MRRFEPFETFATGAFTLKSLSGSCVVVFSLECPAVFPACGWGAVTASDRIPFVFIIARKAQEIAQVRKRNEKQKKIGRKIYVCRKQKRRLFFFFALEKQIGELRRFALCGFVQKILVKLTKHIQQYGSDVLLFFRDFPWFFFKFQIVII